MECDFEKKALFEAMRKRRAEKKEERRERFDKAMAMGKEMTPIEQAYTNGKIDYGTYCNKVKAIAKKHGQSNVVLRREPGKEWMGYKMERVAEYEDAILEKIAMNKMDKVFSRIGEASKKYGVRPVNRTVQTGRNFDGTVNRSMHDAHFQNLVDRGIASAGKHTKGAAQNWFSKIKNSSERDKDFYMRGRRLDADLDLPRKQATLRQEIFKSYNGNTGLPFIKADNHKKAIGAKARSLKDYKHFNARKEPGFGDGSEPDVRYLARKRYNKLLALNKERIGKNPKPNGMPKDIAKWF